MKNNYRIVFSIAVALFIFLGKGVLEHLNYKMGEYAQSNLTKIHPVSYIILTSVIGSIILGNYSIIKNYIRNVAAKYYIIAILLVLFILIINNNSSALSFIIDTLLVPVIGYLYLKDYPASIQARVKHYLVGFIILNSIVAIIERSLTINFFPTLTPYGNVFRSTALLGHPLNNALMTLVFILYIQSVKVSEISKRFYLAISFISLLCFGARGCLFIGSLSIVILYIVPTFFFNKSVHFKDSNKFSAVLFVMTIISIIIYLVVSTNFGERLLQVSYFDESANVRIDSLSLVDVNSIANYFWPKTINEISNMSAKFEVDIIENFLVVWVLRFGLILSLFLVITLVYFLFSIIKTKNRFIALSIVILFFLGAFTNNSLSTSTETIMFFVLLFGLKEKEYVF